jgi:hypothetical protein
MKIIRRTACLLLVGAASTAAWPAQAAGPYTIKGGTGAAFASGAWTMNAARGPACNASVVNHPGQGVDSYTVEVGGFAGRFVNIDWSAEQDQGRLEIKWYNATCDIAIIAGQATSAENPGRWTTLVPSDARWVVVAPALMANVTFSINLA